MRYRIALAVCSLLLFANNAIAASQAQSISLTYNGPPELEDNAVHRFAVTFKDLLELRTGGGIDVVLYPNSHFGGEEERMRLVTESTLMNVASLAGIETVLPEIHAANSPFEFDSFQAARWFFSESPFWTEARSAFHERTGSYLMQVVEDGGFLAFTNSVRAIRQPDDFKGLTFRAMDEAQVTLFQALDALTERIPWTDLPAALRDGKADGQMNPPAYILLGRLYEVQRYASLANVQYSPQFLVINGAWMDDLAAEQAAAVRRSARDANLITGIWVEALYEQRVATLADRGMEVLRPTADELALYRARVVPAFGKWLEKTVDKRWLDLARTSAASANAGN